MHFLSRHLVNDRLRLSVYQSYRIVGEPSHYGARIRSDYVVEMLNRSRCAGEEMVMELPSDILTADEMAAELAESDISAKNLMNWSNRSRNPLPHYRLNKHTRRFRRASVMKWLESSSIHRRSA
jgi:hypothetical protein